MPLMGANSLRVAGYFFPDTVPRQLERAQEENIEGHLGYEPFEQCTIHYSVVSACHSCKD